MSSFSEAVGLSWRADLARERAFIAIITILFLASAGITIYWSRSMARGMAMPGGWTMSVAWMKMPGQTWFAASVAFDTMWVTMMSAMMLPSLMATLLQYRGSIRGHADTNLNRSTVLVALGYLFVWAIFGMFIYPLGVGLSGLAMRWPSFMRVVPQATGCLLLMAGLFQLSPWKARPLERCRTATVCEGGHCSACRHGLRLGIDCVLCCAGLMAALLVNDPMSLATMAAVTVAITVERLARQPERIARVIGVVIIALTLPVIFGSMY